MEPKDSLPCLQEPRIVSWARLIHSRGSDPLSLGFTLILPVLQGFLQKNCTSFLHLFHTTAPHQLRSLLFQLATNVLRGVQIVELPIMHFLQHADTSFLLDTNSSVCTTSRKL
jgi:hypothetical protein